jgi:hypothetical protein
MTPVNKAPARATSGKGMVNPRFSLPLGFSMPLIGNKRFYNGMQTGDAADA